METFQVTARQAYNHGVPYGTVVTLWDSDGKILGRARGGGYDLQGAVFRQWARNRFKLTLPDNADFMIVQDAIRPLGYRLRKVLTTPGLDVYVLTKDGEE